MKIYFYFTFIFFIVSIECWGQSDNCSSSSSLLTPNTTCNVTSANNSSLSDGSNFTNSCHAGANNNRDGWFRFVTYSTSHTITVDGNSSFDAVVSVFSSCGGSAISGGTCIDATGNDGVETVNLTGLTIGNTYYIMVYNFGRPNSSNSSNNGYTICVTGVSPPPANDNCSGAVSLTHSANGTCTTTNSTWRVLHNR